MARVVLIIAALFAVLFVLLLASPPAVRRHMETRYGVGAEATESGQTRLIGLAANGQFVRLGTDLGDRTPGLTRMPMQAARAPESEQLYLDDFDGRVVIVEGRDSGGWIYSAQVVVVFGPFASMLIRHAYGG
ncbi:MAG: hypothetical protein FJZ90_05480 [Chloroflexi bacterium]|nr:hypothetical protein [Chloroflexota bacterium]